MTRRKFIRSSRGLAGALCLAGLLVSQPAMSIDLLESYRLALAKSPGWLAARAQADAERTEKPMALAQMLPSLSWSMSRFNNDLESSNLNFLGKKVISESEYVSENKTWTLRQPLFRPQLYFGYRQAEATVAAAEARLDLSEQDIVVKVSGAYFETLMAQDQLNFITAQLAANQGQMKAARRSFEKGLGTRTDIDEAQARVDLSTAQKMEAEQALLEKRHQLEALINTPVDTLATVRPEVLPLQVLEPLELATWIENATSANPELKLLSANIEAAQREVSKQRASHLPTVDLVAQRVDAQSDNPTSANSGYINSQWGMQINVPLFSGGYYLATTDRALASLEKVRQQFENARQDVAVRVRREFQAVAQGVLKIKAYEQAEQSASRLIYSTRKGIQAGTRTQIDLLNAEQQLMNARRDLAQARYVFIMARMRLQALIGGIDENFLMQINSYLGSGDSSAKG
jgi:outer membrane protein/protease secretion system outer membrane protein